MQNSGENDDLSSTASHSFSGDDDGGSATASEESGWTSYIDYFLETQQRQQRKEEVSRAGDPSTDDAGWCSSTSTSTWLPAALVEPSVASRWLSLREGWRRRKKKAMMYDESLEDTATSPISSPKLIELIRDSDVTHHQKKVNSCAEISRSKRKSTGGDVNKGQTQE